MSLAKAALLEKFRNLVASLTATGYTENNTVAVESSVLNSGLTVTCVYKRVSPTSDTCASCDVFIEDMHISSGRMIENHALAKRGLTLYHTIPTFNDLEKEAV